MKVRRDILLFAAVAVAALGGGWWLIANRPGASIETFVRDHARLEQARQQVLPPAEAFRARVCQGGPCVVIEAGGLTFVFGAGMGAAEGLRDIGNMHAKIDGVLVPDLSVRSVEGLSAIAAASAKAGRTTALRVYGPTGIVPVVDGANLLASGSEAVRLSVGPEGESQDGVGRLVFDSGVVAIQAFGRPDRGASRVYRIDFDGKSLILAGCLSEPDDLVMASRGVQLAAGVVAASASALLGGRTSPCADVSSVTESARMGRLQGLVVTPADPDLMLESATEAWREVLAAAFPTAILGQGRAGLDLSGPDPRPITPW